MRKRNELEGLNQPTQIITGRTHSYIHFMIDAFKKQTLTRGRCRNFHVETGREQIAIFVKKRLFRLHPITSLIKRTVRE